MAYRIVEEEIWIGTVADRVGGLADKLEAVADADKNLEFMLAMRNLDMPGTGVLLLTPLQGEGSVQAAQSGGLSKWTSAFALRIEGPDRQGLGSDICRTVANAGVSLRGATAMRFGDRAVIHLAFDSRADAGKAQEALYQAFGH